jgi:AraC family transcriptional regulator
MNRAVDYIENNLCDDIDLETIAKITCQSTTSFQRTFSIVTEMPVSEYIRRRRMSLAALDLQNNYAKVIDTSLKYGYDSPEAFARAFKEIYGISPSAARKKDIMLRIFPRLSFLMTIKGDVIMNYEQENNTVRVTNIYCKHMPAIRFIGKRYTTADLDANGLLMDRWNEWFQNGWFDLLNRLPGLSGYEGIPNTGYHNGAETTFWIGMMFPQNTPVPEGFDTTDIPAGDLAVCWLHGYRETGELFTPLARSLCLAQIREAGYTMKLDFDGEPCKWTFESYNHQRFFMPDDEGKVVMDYCVYVVEPEMKARVPFHEDELEGQDRYRVDGGVKGPMPEVLITSVSPYWTDVESNLLLCAMTTLFLKLENYDETSPFYCARSDRYCNGCGDCGDMSKRSSLDKHHLYLYHHLLTVTGVGLMCGDPNEAGEYDLKYIRGITPPMLEDRLDFAMKAEGFEYIRLDKLKGEQEIFRQVTGSIRGNKPVLMKLGDGPEWCVVTGFDSATGTLFGLDAKDHITYQPANKREYTEDGLFIITDWFKNLRKAIIVTGEATQTLDFIDLLERIVGRLQLPERSVLESMIPQMIDSICVENARAVAEYLNNIAGYMVEARWHGAECFGSILRKTEDETAQVRLRECMDLYFNTHDTCWQIWGQMGVGPHTNYKLPGHISKMMLDKKRQEKLKELFAQIFGNDHAVLEKLQGLVNIGDRKR